MRDIYTVGGPDKNRNGLVEILSLDEQTGSMRVKVQKSNSFAIIFGSDEPDWRREDVVAEQIIELVPWLVCGNQFLWTVATCPYLSVSCFTDDWIIFGENHWC